MSTNDNAISSAISKVYMKNSTKTAMILNNGNKISYDDMMWDISMTCNVLIDNGIQKDSKVALFMDKSPQCVETFLAIIKTGAIVVLLDYAYTESQIQEILDSEKPDLVFVRNNQLDVVKTSSTMLDLADNRVLRKVDKNVSKSVPTLASASENDNAIVTYSVAENGLLERNVLTHAAFVKMTMASKKSSNPMNSLVNGLKNFVAPLFKGSAVKALV